MPVSTAVSIALGLALAAVVIGFVVSSEVNTLRRQFREVRMLRYRAGDILVVHLTVPVTRKGLEHERRQFERWGEALGARVIVLPVEYDLSILRAEAAGSLSDPLPSDVSSHESHS